MRLPESQRVRNVLVPFLARAFRTYIERHNRRHPDREATVKQIARRFRMPVADVAYCIEHGDAGMVVSLFAYTPPEGSGWAEILLHSFHPQLAENTALGRRVVRIIDEHP